MRYVKDTLEYLFVRGKGVRFFAFWLIVLAPSVMIAYGLPLGGFVRTFLSPVYEDWTDVWFGAFRSNWGFASIGIGLVVAALAVACGVGLLIRHFRVGDFKANLPRCVNDYFLPAALHTAAITVGVAFCYTLFSLFRFLWYRSYGATAQTVLSAITFFVIFGGFTYVSSSLTVWFPYMCVKGVYNGNAFVSSFYQSRTKQKYFLPGHIVVALVLIVTAVVSYFVSDVWYVGWIVDSVGFSAAFAFCFVFSTVAYFGENALPREDRSVSPFKRR